MQFREHSAHSVPRFRLNFHPPIRELHQKRLKLATFSSPGEFSIADDAIPFQTRIKINI